MVSPLLLANMTTLAMLATSVVMPSPLRPQSAATFYATGRAQMELDTPEAATKSFEKAVALDMTNADYHFWLGRAMGFSVMNASILRRPFLAHHIKSEFERALQLDSLNVDAREGLAMYYTRAPGIFGGSMAKARAQADTISTLSSLRGHFARAAIDVEEKDSAGADGEFLLAIAENPDSLAVVTTYVDHLVTNNRVDDAFAVVDRFLGRHPADPVAPFWIGKIAAISGKQLDRGEQALRLVLGTPNLGTLPDQPQPYAVHFWLGMIAAKSGKKDVARSEYGISLQLNPSYRAARKALKSL